MGYRPNICVKNNYGLENIIYYGTKLYGYHDKVEDLLSFNYLIKIHKFKKEDYKECFTYGIENKIRLTNMQFKAWFELYKKDLCNINIYDYNENQSYYLRDFRQIDEAIKKKYDFIIYWD